MSASKVHDSRLCGVEVAVADLTVEGDHDSLIQAVRVRVTHVEGSGLEREGHPVDVIRAVASRCAETKCAATLDGGDVLSAPLSLQEPTTADVDQCGRRDLGGAVVVGGGGVGAVGIDPVAAVVALAVGDPDLVVGEEREGRPGWGPQSLRGHLGTGQAGRPR